MEGRNKKGEDLTFSEDQMPQFGSGQISASFRSFFLLGIFWVISAGAFAQSDIAEFLKAGKADANSLIKAYLNPYANAFGDGLNMGWYNSAKTHKLGGLDLAISVTAIQIPKKDQTFDLNSMNFQKITLADPSNHWAPTVAGKKEPGPELLVKDSNGTGTFSFNSPQGVGLSTVPLPMVQLTFGILPHTDVIGRLVPELKRTNDGDEMKAGFWGIGVKHNFMEWIPGLRELPFDAAIFGSVSQVNGQSELTLTPQDYNEPSAIITYTDTDDQLMKLTNKTSRYGLVVSKKLGVLTFFGGIGQSSSETSIDVLGKYPVLNTDSHGNLIISNEDAIYNPVAISFKAKNVCMDAGLRLKLAFFSIFGSVNKSVYTSFTGGISLGFR